MSNIHRRFQYSYFFHSVRVWYNTVGKSFILNRLRNDVTGLAVIASLWGCASQAPPSGGPEDKTPPRIHFTDPATDSVHVSRSPAITIQFSEPMSKLSVEQSLFISPRPSKPLSFNWKKNNLIITLPDSLDSNQTCVITVGIGAKDAHQNPLQPYTFAFSTGSKIDRGNIGGSVFYSSFNGMNIWAYNIDKVEHKDCDSLIFMRHADYVTSVNELGHFQLSYLVNGAYRLFAIVDQDQNDFYSPGIDLIGLPDGDHVLNDDSNHITGMLFHVMREDTTHFTVGTLRALDDQTVLVGFTEPLQKPDSMFSTESFLNRIRLIDLSTKDTVPVHDVYLNTVHFLEMKFLTELLDSAHQYEMTMDTVISAQSDTLIAIKDTLKTFDFYQPEPATIEWILPDKEQTVILPNDRISVRFNKGIDRESFEKGIILQSDSVPIRRGRWNWTFSGLAEYIHDTLFLAGKLYEFVLQPKAITDWQKMTINDTTVTFAFQSFSTDSLGVVSGRFSVNPLFASKPHLLTLRNMNQGKRLYQKTICTDQPFQFDFVIPGKYILEAFVDRNHDGRFNMGSVIPFEPPEPFKMYHDTISVRANWETTGIHFNFK